MCISCLQVHLESIDDYQKKIVDYIKEHPCNCGNCFIYFLKKTNQDIKMLCLLKIKRNEQHCLNSIRCIKQLENRKMKAVKEKLANMMEQLFDEKETLRECDYLTKTNQIKELHEIIGYLEEADHR